MLDCVNLSIAIPAFQPNIVDDLHIHGSPSVPQSMYPIFSQGGIVVVKLFIGMASCILISALLILQRNVLRCKKIQVSSAWERSIHRRRHLGP
jgi:hypothetical protein